VPNSNFGNGAGSEAFRELLNIAGKIGIDMVAGSVAGGTAGAVIGGEIGSAVGAYAADGVGMVSGGAAGAATGAVAGALVGASTVLVRDLTVMYSKSGEGGTPRQAQVKIGKRQGPRDIERIDEPGSQPRGQWHTHTKDGAINQDGTIRHGNPSLTKKSIEWLRRHNLLP